jgi:hypothetical protein
MRTAELAQELILCITSLLSRGAYPRDFVAFFEELAIWSSFLNYSCAIKADDVEIFRDMIVVI